MIAKLKKITFLLLLFILCYVKSNAQITASDITNTTINNLTVKDTTVPDILLLLAIKYSIPIGLEYPNSEASQNKKIEIDIKDLPLRRVCDLIVQLNPDFKWELNDGVVNFLPAHNRNSLVEKLLKTNISSYAPMKPYDRIGLKTYLIFLPEVKELYSREKVFDFTTSDYGHRGAAMPEGVLQAQSNIDFRSLLNNIAKGSPRNFWIVHWVGIPNKQNALEVDF